MLARSGPGEPYPVDPGEVAGVAWLTYDEFLADPRTQEWTRESLRLAERARLTLDW